MSNFNERTALNYRLRQDALTTQHRSQMARQRIAYRSFRRCVRTVAVDAALVGVILMGVMMLLVCAVS